MHPNLYASITALAYALPMTILDNNQLIERFPEWNVEKIEKKTGIRERRITTSQESALDLGVAAASDLLNNHPEMREKIDALLFCTESPDYCLPPNACLAQDILGLRNDIPATDFSLGCSGFVWTFSCARWDCKRPGSLYLAYHGRNLFQVFSRRRQERSDYFWRWWGGRLG